MEKKDYIEELITVNLSVLNNKEPEEGHFERFREKLNQQKMGISFSWRSAGKVVAAVVFLFLAVNQARIWMAPEASSAVTLSAVSQEYAEVEFYYTSAIREGISNLDAMARTGVISEQENEIMQQEFAAFESRYAALQKELEANPRDERVINAMIGYYQAKLGVIQMILDKLQEVKQQNTKSHGTEI